MWTLTFMDVAGVIGLRFDPEKGIPVKYRSCPAAVIRNENRENGRRRKSRVEALG
jgi:hypothetical protein